MHPPRSVRMQEIKAKQWACIIEGRIIEFNTRFEALAECRKHPVAWLGRRIKKIC